MSFRIYILLVLAMFAVSTSPIIARYLDHLSPITIALWRMVIAAFIMSFYGYYRYDFKPMSSANHIKIVIAGILLGTHFALFYGAIALMPNNIANATVFGTMAPLFALFIEIYFGKSISKKLIFGLLIVLLGSSIMFIYDFSIDNNLTIGNILAILCSICFAFVFILSDQVNKTEHSFNFSKNVFSLLKMRNSCLKILTHFVQEQNQAILSVKPAFRQHILHYEFFILTKNYLQVL